ncbi:fibroblast growth factor 1-like isoform X1 [Haliotis asinina]|uniref:fibroblast growth factor 1-like isoform X1 n=1 Tax=Haliotis asinina TaxID=109174 RepID=UPI0035322743
MSTVQKYWKTVLFLQRTYWKLKLLPLLLIILLSILGVNAVHGSSNTKNGIFKIDRQVAQNPGSETHSLKYQLFNRCSKGYVQIKRTRAKKKGNRIQILARGGRQKSITTHLIFESRAGGDIYIKSPQTKKYICFNKKGKLILRHTQKPQCLFTQVERSDNYTELRSKANEEWYIGFRENGKRLKGYARRNRRREKCFHFLVINLTPAPRKPWKIKGFLNRRRRS